ncbi:LPS export ABC transporter permease LptF [Sphingomonas daechungensis]|uniref:LPS export ABC transporter permease LptF n=1 Tax=Sphingomonas daechungensis TaxID=1176646 RepID=A0ABX6T0P4_9SPHN|nr:LPS export ABC transporter permease LptF [Sphingomonas daechungensis]QNP43265.1 LPS export ABC transporter permease LptF [Sphingomonas daechungensis]
MRRLSLIDRYLTKQIAVPLFGTLLLAAMLLVLDKMLRLFDFVVTAGGPVSVVWRMLANLLPEYFSLGIPIGLMLGILLAFRKLALSSELDALRGIGAGFGRLLRVPYGFTVVLLLLNLFIVGWIQPWTHYGYERLRFDLRSGALGASVKVGEFNNLGRKMTLRIDRSEHKGTQLHGIFVQVDDRSGMSVAATAQQGRFLSTDDPDVILFRLEHGRLIQNSPKFATPRTLSFDLYDLPINLPRVDSFRQRGHEELEELTLPELFRVGYFDPKASKDDRMGAQANFHFRIVEVLMMLMLPLLAVALAVPPKRSSSALGIFIGIVIIVAYHKVNQYAEQAAARGSMDPILAMWIPLFALSALIIWMYHVLAHRPGGQPIGALERAFARVGKSLRKLLPKVQPA